MIDSTPRSAQGASVAGAVIPTGGAASSSAASSAAGVASPLGGGFDAALAAAARAEAGQKARDDELAQIREKGFSAWVRDMRVEKLKEELRKKVMAEMGLTEEDMARMNSVLRQTLEQRIKDEIEKRLVAALAESDGSQSNGSQSNGAATGAETDEPAGRTAVPRTNAVIAAQQIGGDDDRAATARRDDKDGDGIYCPVIPALATPGASLF